MRTCHREPDIPPVECTWRTRRTWPFQGFPSKARRIALQAACREMPARCASSGASIQPTLLRSVRYRTTVAPHSMMGCGFAMVATKVNAFIAEMNPNVPLRDIDTFLHEAANSLGLKSDADLARAMAASPVTFASWKRRGKLPAERVQWFQTTFPAMVFNRWRDSVPPYGSRAVEAALGAVHRHYGSAIGKNDRRRQAAIAFGGLVAFVPLIAHTRFDVEKDEAPDMPLDDLIEVLAIALAWREETGL